MSTGMIEATTVRKIKYVEGFKEVFVKDKDLSSSHVMLEEKSFEASEGRLKSTIVFDSSYMN